MSIDLKSLKVKNVLNKQIWSKDGTLKPEVRERLIVIAEDFYKELEVPWATLEDIRFTGSLANYNWSKYSDIDLHLIVDYSLVDENENLVENYFNVRKNLWNNNHDIMIHGFEVEVYVEDNDEVHHSSGIYSVLFDDWIIKPERQHPCIDKDLITQKAKIIMKLIDDLVIDKVKKRKYAEAITTAELLTNKIKKMRKAGLESGGEFSVENLTFKILKRNGTLDKLRSTKLKAYDKMMSL